MASFKDIFHKILNSDKLISISANIIAILIFMGTAWLSLESKVESEVAERLEPYEYLQEALSLSQSGQYDQSMEPFEKAFSVLSKKEISVSRLKSVVNPYLEAMAFVEFSHQYSHNFKNILKVINEKIPDDGAIFANAAWVYFESGDLKNAHKFFAKSLKVYSAEEKMELSFFAIWGMALTVIAEGDIDRALHLFELLFQLNAKQYSPSETVNYSIISYGGYGEKYIRLYPGFETSYNRFLDRVKEKYQVVSDIPVYQGDVNYDLLKE